MAIGATGLALGSAAIKGIVGAAQGFKGRNILKNTTRPDYEIPEEIKQNLTQAQLAELEGLPAEQKAEYLKQINRSASSALANSSNRMAGISGLGGILDSQNNAFSNLLSMDAQARDRNRANTSMARNQMASYKDNQFQLNKMDPFMNKVAEGQALTGAGIQNTMGAIDDVGAILLQQKSSGMSDEEAKKAAENQINNDPNLSEEQKKRMLSQLINQTFYGTN